MMSWHNSFMLEPPDPFPYSLPPRTIYPPAYNRQLKCDGLYLYIRKTVQAGRLVAHWHVLSGCTHGKSNAMLRSKLVPLHCALQGRRGSGLHCSAFRKVGRSMQSSSTTEQALEVITSVPCTKGRIRGRGWVYESDDVIRNLRDF
jgi:hypothetical protein